MTEQQQTDILLIKLKDLEKQLELTRKFIEYAILELEAKDDGV